MKEKILIVDFGSQYSQLICKKVEKLGVCFDSIQSQNFQNTEGYVGVIISGGPKSVYEENIQTYKNIIGKVPILGICYGMQLIHQLMGGEVKKSQKGNYGRYELSFRPHQLMKGVKQKLMIWSSHADYVHKVADGFEVIGETDVNQIAVCDKWKIYTLQFHPEADDTNEGEKILSNFLDICGCKKDDNLTDLLEVKIKNIQTVVGTDRVILALSGGVDSSVTAKLLQRAIGNQLSLIFVNNGLLNDFDLNRFKQEFEGVKILEKKEEFLGCLSGVMCSETKRKKIGSMFVKVFEEYAATQKGIIKFLAQGTIISDVIESGGGGRDVIKSHHNVGGMPDNDFILLEPLKDLFKNEVIELGKLLGMKRYILDQEPFPGPGLAIRISGEVSEHKLDILRKADAIFKQHLNQHSLHYSQSFAILIPNTSVGVKGDNRSEGYLIILRSVVTFDFMTAEISLIPHSHLIQISKKITNEVKEITRVAFDVTSKPPGTIEWE